MKTRLQKKSEKLGVYKLGNYHFSEEVAIEYEGNLHSYDVTNESFGFINNSAKLRTKGEKKKDNRFVSQYTERPAECEPLSLYNYFLYQNNDGNKAKRNKI